MQVALRTSGASKSCSKRSQRPFQGRSAAIVRAHPGKLSSVINMPSQRVTFAVRATGDSIARREVLAAPLLLSGLLALQPSARADDGAVEVPDAPAAEAPAVPVAPPAPVFAGKVRAMHRPLACMQHHMLNSSPCSRTCAYACRHVSCVVSCSQRL